MLRWRCGVGGVAVGSGGKQTTTSYFVSDDDLSKLHQYLFTGVGVNADDGMNSPRAFSLTVKKKSCKACARR